MGAIKQWPWRKIVFATAACLIVIGLAPTAWLWWWESAHNLQPLSVPISLKQGVSTSPYFTTDLDETYQIDIYFVPYDRSPINLDWQIVDEQGTLLKSGQHREREDQAGGNIINLDRNYRARRGLRQKIIVSILKDVQAYSGYAGETRLYVELPEDILGDSYAFPLAIFWTACVAGTGLIMLLVLAILRFFRPSTPGSDPSS